MLKKSLSVCFLAAAFAATAGAQGHDKDKKGMPHLDHAFVIMMENHGFYQVYGNPNEAYLNKLISSGEVNFATNYFAVGHPSLTNYLEIVGGSNFGVRSDNAPAWGSNCTPNIGTGVVNADNAAATAMPPGPLPPGPIDTGSVCPITGKGTDAATPAVDNWNEVGVDANNKLVIPYLADIEGLTSVPAAPTVGKTIADQLVEAGQDWKTYQESLPLGPVFGVNDSNGTATNLTNFGPLAPLTTSSILQAYAVKHNPFAYFKSVQGTADDNKLDKVVVGFDGPGGLYADLANDKVPAFSFIVPNQCNDQHGRGNGDAFCAFDPGSVDGFTYGTVAGLNPGLIQQGDTTIERLVEAIHASHVWNEGNNAIVIVWDENDYSGITTAPTGAFPLVNQNKVVLTVETNRHEEGVQSSTYYNSFSLLKSLEDGFGLPCLNHACDSSVAEMSDLFSH